MKNNLKNELKNYYDSKKLSSERISNLQEIQRSKGFFNFDWRIASAITTMFIVIMGYNFLTTPLSEKIAKEVSYNHSKNMPPEVMSNDYELINEALDRLNFKVRQSSSMDKRIVLVGGRYCSIQGEIAAQLHFENSGKRLTLYQFKINEKTKNLSKSLVNHKNVKVKIWQEEGIGYALAEDLD